LPAPPSRLTLPASASIPIAFTAFSVILIGIGEVLSPGYASAANMLQLLSCPRFLALSRSDRRW
jgi:hypothetical protein